MKHFAQAQLFRSRAGAGRRTKMPHIRSITVLLLSALALLLLSAAPAFSQYSIETRTEISWITGDILISATAEIPPSETNITSARFRITETIDRGLTSIVTGAFDDIYLDSLQTLSDGFTSSRKRLTDFDALNLTKSRVSSSMSRDLDSVTNLYKYNIFNDLIPLLISHRKNGSGSEGSQL